MFSCFSRLRKRLCDISRLGIHAPPPPIVTADKLPNLLFRFLHLLLRYESAFVMAEASIEGMDISLREVERIIGYQFNSHGLLTCSLWELSTDVVDPPPNLPRPDFLVRMGQIALDAIGWELVWTRAFLLGGFQDEEFYRYTLSNYVLARGAWDVDTNLKEVASVSGLLPYLERRKGYIGPRVQAIIGAVFYDTGGKLVQVKNVLRALRIIDDEGLYSTPSQEVLVEG